MHFSECVCLYLAQCYDAYYILLRCCQKFSNAQCIHVGVPKGFAGCHGPVLAVTDRLPTGRQELTHIEAVIVKQGNFSP